VSQRQAHAAAACSILSALCPLPAVPQTHAEGNRHGGYSIEGVNVSIHMTLVRVLYRGSKDATDPGHVSNPHGSRLNRDTITYALPLLYRSHLAFSSTDFCSQSMGCLRPRHVNIASVPHDILLSTSPCCSNETGLPKTGHVVANRYLPAVLSPSTSAMLTRETGLPLEL
jgi:hypothetical protein